MACYNPIPAYRTDSGDVVMLERGSIRATLTLACGSCIGCRLERSRQWAVRIMHEAMMWEENCFITLTYDKDSVPPYGSLRYSDFQRFMKYLRAELAPNQVRFFMCGEYGEKFDRPHYHAAIFNYAFLADRRFSCERRSYKVYTSAQLDRLWKFGRTEIGELTHESAGYIARYIMKKINGDLADDYYAVVDEVTGEVNWREPEFTHMSLKPGIGAGWFKQFHTDVYPHDRLVANGIKQKPPRYYDKLFKRVDPDVLESLKEKREADARLRYSDNTPERLEVRKAVAKSRLSFYKREMK